MGLRIEGGGGAAAQGRKRVLLLIPGNPGLPDFYCDFLPKLASSVGGVHRSVCLGHAFHSPFIKAGQKAGLREQYEHKVQFVEKEFGHELENIDFFLAGHSIGARCCLELMHRLHGRVHVERVFMLCPTVVDMINTPNGMKLGPILMSDNMHRFASWLATILRVLLPQVLLRPLSRLLVKNDPCDAESLEHVLHCVHGNFVANILHMARDEMHHVVDVVEYQSTAIASHGHKFSFFLSPTDLWVPHRCIRSLQQSFPTSRFQLLSKDVSHSFVLTTKAVDEMLLHCKNHLQDEPK